MKDKNNKHKYTSISLFTGAFGLDLGLEKAGFETKVCVEKDFDCVSTIIKNKPKLKDRIICKDIIEVSSREILKIAGLKRGEVALVSGGPPCQPFSTVGRRQSIDSNEGQLFDKFLDMVWDIYPQFFIFENVKGILSAAIKHTPLKERDKSGKRLKGKRKLGSGWDFINRQFSNKLRKGKKNGYTFFTWEVNAADYGVAQNRKRVFIVGVRGNKCNLEKPDGKYKKKPRTLEKVIGKLKGEFERPGIDYYQYDTLRYNVFKENLIKAGENWKVLPIALQKRVMGKGWYATGGKVGFCRRLSWDKPAPTITTNPSGRATNLCHPDKPRPLNYTECALVQGFPKSWKFVGSLSKKYKQIGNAVPIKLATAIGKSIIDFELESDPIFESVR